MSERKWPMPLAAADWRLATHELLPDLSCKTPVSRSYRLATSVRYYIHGYLVFLNWTADCWNFLRRLKPKKAINSTGIATSPLPNVNRLCSIELSNAIAIIPRPMLIVPTANRVSARPAKRYACCKLPSVEDNCREEETRMPMAMIIPKSVTASIFTPPVLRRQDRIGSFTFDICCISMLAQFRFQFAHAAIGTHQTIP